MSIDTFTATPNTVSAAHAQAMLGHYLQEVDRASSLGGGVALTPDSLMAYCAARLRDLDGQVRDRFETQRSNQDASQAINGLLQDVSKFSARGADPAEMSGLFAKYAALVERFGASSPVGAALQRALDAAQNRFTASGAGSGLRVTPEQIAEGIDDLKRVQSDLNANSELNMIELQSLVSQRQMAVQLCTNLLAKLDEGQMAIVRNVGK